MVAVPELRVATQSTQEGLLERVVGGVRADHAAQVGVNRIAVLVVEAFEGRKRHGLHHLL